MHRPNAPRSTADSHDGNGHHQKAEKKKGPGSGWIRFSKKRLRPESDPVPRIPSTPAPRTGYDPSMGDLQDYVFG